MLSDLKQICNELIFQVKPEDFSRRMEDLRKEWFEDNHITCKQKKKELMEALADITLDLQSYLVRWNLQKPGDPKALSNEELKQEIEWNYQILMCHARRERVEAIKAEAESIAKSNLMAMTRATDRGNLNTYWGNDYASGLREAMRRGAVTATTNPQLVNTARKENPDMWDPIRDRILQENPTYSPEELGTAMTIEVVLDNAKEMMPIYRATDGKLGYVSLQVNPNNAFDSESMLEEALLVYNTVQERMGERPNVVFKVPGTSSGVDVVKELTARGIGVNVTVNFTVAQQLVFADAIEGGKAPVSFLTEMNGRLDDLVYSELDAQGIEDAKEVSSWAGVAVTRRAYSMLYTGEEPHTRSALLVASLRGPWHIDRSLSSGKIPLYITIFPDKAEDYDSKPRSIEASLHEEVPKEILDKLAKSETFRKAYEPDGLAISDFDTYTPVKKTLSGFRDSYDDFLSYFKK